MTNGSRGSGTQDKVVDDWFEEQGAIDWLPAVEEEVKSAPRPRRGRDLEPSGHEGSETTVPRGDEHQDQARNVSEIVRRRRAILLLAVITLVALAIVVPVVAFEGGGGKEAVRTSRDGTVSEQTRAPSPDATVATPPAPAPSPAPSPAPPAAKPKPAIVVELPEDGRLSRGDSGEAVVTLQKALLALEFDPGSPDGDFGANTEAAVVSFQEANDLEPDGIVGKKTASKLNAALSAGSSP
jgi:hypothetical protein